MSHKLPAVAILLASLFFGSKILAQEENTRLLEKRIDGKDTIILEIPFPNSKEYRRVAPAIEPRFIGDLKQYVAKNLVVHANEHGLIKIICTITKEGAVSGARVIKSFSPGLDAQALRLVNDMPQWIPARMDGYPIPWIKTIDISF